MTRITHIQLPPGKQTDLGLWAEILNLVDNDREPPLSDELKRCVVRDIITNGASETLENVNMMTEETKDNHTRPVGDLHAWIEMADGTIYDPTPNPDTMGLIITTRNLDTSKLDERRYEPFKGRKRSNALKRLNKFLDQHQAEIEEMGMVEMEGPWNFEYLKRINYKEDGNCFRNCRAWSSHNQDKPHKIQYGKCGWATKDGGVWFEWG